MQHIQLLRNGFPDPKFFGNTFVALSLASNIDDGLLMAKPKKEGFVPSQQQEWIQIAKENLGVSLQYCNYLDDYGKNDLADIVQKSLRKSEGPVIVNFHYAETELQKQICSVLPVKFGKDVKQFMHLHCSADFFLRRTKEAEERKKMLLNAYEQGWIHKYIPVSYEVKDSFLSVLPQEAMETIQNGIPEHIYTFRPERDKDAFKNQFCISGKFIIGYSGRLDQIKGYNDLIAILNWFDARPSYDVGFLIASPGGAKLKDILADLKDKAPRLLRENRCGMVLDVAKYTGEKKQLNTEAYEFFNKFVEEHLFSQCDLYSGISPAPLQAMVDIYIQPSESEGLPLSVIEAVFTGTPVVAYRVGGLKEIVSPAHGALVDRAPKQKQRVNEFCEAIAFQIEQNYQLDGLKDTANYREEVRDRLVPVFGAKAMAGKMAKVYAK